MENKQLNHTSFDFSQEERESLDNYKSNGCPSLLKTSESDAFQWFELYMSGKTYLEIATLTNSKRDVILYFSEKCAWHEKRMAHYSDMSDAVVAKCMASKLEALDTMTTMVSALNKYYGGKFNKYLKNKDDSIIEEIDTKMLSQYYKVMDSIDKIINPKNPEEPNSGVPKATAYTQNTSDVLDSIEDEDGEVSENEASEALKNLAILSRSRKK